MPIDLLAIWIAVITASMSVVLLVAVMLSRAVVNRRNNSLKRGQETMRPLIINYLLGDLEIADILPVALKNRSASVRLIFSFIAALTGAERKALIDLVKQLKLDEQLLRGLKSPRWRTRENSATQLGMLMLPESVPKLVKLLDDPVREVRQTSARSLAMSSSDLGFSAFLDLLRKPGKVEYSRLLEIVQFLPQPKVEPLIELFEDETVGDELKLLLLNYINDWCDYRMIGLLVRLLDHENLEMKIRAIKTLARIGAHEAIPQILVDIDHPSWEVRVQVIKAVQLLEFEAALPLLIEALEDQVYWVRFNAAQTLTLFGISDITQELNSPDAAGFAKDMFRYHSQRSAQSGAERTRDQVASVQGGAG